MATGPSKRGTFNASGSMSLGGASSFTVGRWLVHIEGDGWSGSVVPQARGIADGSFALRDVAYYDVESGEMANTALTSDHLILVDGSGQHVTLKVTVSSGSVRVTATPLIG